MAAHFHVFLGLLCVLVGCIGCSQAPIVYRPLTSQEVQTYTTQHGITPVATKVLSQTTIIAFDTANKATGICSLAKEQGGKLFELCSSTQQSSPVVEVMSEPTGQPRAAVVIHDAQVAQRTGTVTVTFANGQHLTAQTQGQRGVIIIDPAVAAGIRSVTLSSASGETVYEQRLP